MMQQFRRRKFLAATGSIGAIGLAGCLGGNGSDGESDIQVGVLQPLTGPLGSVGQPVSDAAELPAMQVNDADADVTVDIQVEDTATDSQTAISAAQSLADANYPAISGPLSTETTLQVVQNVSIPNDIVQCTLGTAPSITDVDDNDLLFRTSGSDLFMSQAVAQIADEEVSASDVSILAINDSYGQAMADAFSEAFSGEIAAEVSFESEESSYTSQLTEALSDDPDAMFVVAFTENGIQILRDFYADFSTDINILAASGLYNPEISGSVDGDLTNIAGATEVGGGPSLDFFTESYQTEFGTDPGQFTWQAYDATAVLMLASAAAGENSGSAIRDTLREVADSTGEEVGAEDLAEGLEMAADGEDVNYQGVSSDITFDDNGDIETPSYAMYNFAEDGTLQLGDQIDVSSG